MDFGDALRALKEGKWVAREGWRRTHLYLEDAWGFVPSAGVFKGQQRSYEPCLVAFTEGKHQPGWLASQTDMLAEDWMVVPP